MKSFLMVVFLGVVTLSGEGSAQSTQNFKDAIPGKVYGAGMHYKRIDVCGGMPVVLKSKLLLQTKANVVSNFSGRLDLKISFVDKEKAFVPVLSAKIINSSTVEQIDNEIIENLRNSTIHYTLHESSKKRELYLKIYFTISEGEYFGNIRADQETVVNAC